MKSIIILYTFFAILILLPSQSSQLKQFTYEDPKTGLDLLDNDKSNDGTIILRFGNPVKQVNGSTTCWSKTLYFRIIYPNASIGFFSISNHGIPDFNFCLKSSSERDYTSLWGFDQGFMLIFYNSSNVTTSAIMGTFITFEGKVLSTVRLHDPIIDYGGIENYLLIIPNSNSRDGFLFYCRSPTVISWVHFNTPNENGEIIVKAKSGIIQTNFKNIVTISAFYMLERGFVLAYGGDDSSTNLNNSNIDISIGTTNGVYIMFYYIETNTQIGPFSLYQFSTTILKSYNNQTLIHTLELRGIICSVDFSGAGNICLLLLNSQFNMINNTNTALQPSHVMMKISYRSFGSVTERGEMKSVSDSGFSLQPLRFGGYLLIAKNDIISGYILDENGDLYGNWSLPQPLNNLQYKSIYVILANDSIAVVDYQINSTWRVISEDLFKLTGQDNIFNNPTMASTNPKLGSQVNETTKQLYLSFNYPVILSSSNISIYQRTNGSDHDLLRQRFIGYSDQYCRIDPNDNKTVIVDVLPSTFNEPNSLYYVTVENNFVRRSDSNEALLGIDKNLWTLVTGPITSIIRLTPKASIHYLSLSSDDQQKFNQQMATDLSNVIPVEGNRLTPTNRFEKDMSTGTLQILLSFDIKDTADLSKKSASDIYKDFSNLLKYKDYNALKDYNTTSLIDEYYLITIAPIFLKDYLVLIIIIVIALLIFAILYFWAAWKFKNAENFIIFKIIILVADLGLRMSFVMLHARKVPELWLPSKNPKFSKWFSEYGVLLPFFTILSAGHIEALNILSSKIGMLKIFSTTFSKPAENAIFWIGIFDSIVDIPQFIVQILFRVNTVTVNIIPQLTLISNAVIIVYNVLSGIYQAVYWCLHRVGDNKISCEVLSARPGTDEHIEMVDSK
ncbi:28856_t:CDS:10 [Gigaspora margarita]|uniref:28856_t:CDS:1 n=1 Tax=Gigaspora margarita TaxID=4874 RepID=A0ABN7UU48_GIGMA|nr:28856_t:CDS:10 [Gigaspora margarita]